MDLIHGLILIGGIHLLAAAAPGPDFVMVSQQTMTHGKRSGFWCSLGISVGLSIHIAYSAMGLAAVIAHSTALLWIIKVLGASYLLYLGYQGLRAKPSVEANTHAPLSSEPAPSAASAFYKGVLCNALNPKAPIYFVSIFTVVLSADMPAVELCVYGAWMMLIQFGWFATLTWLLARPAVIARMNKSKHWVERVCGGAMIVLGVKILSSKAN